MKHAFQVTAPFSPSADQKAAIEQLLVGLLRGDSHQTLLGVTGSGKTFVMANLIAAANRPALILAPNKILAAQLYAEMRQCFPDHAVEYFVSYYDYYQPEAYVPSTDTYIAKDAAINEQIEQMRLSATKSLLERRDTVIVASVSAIYGLGDPEAYRSMVLPLSVGMVYPQRKVLHRLTDMQYHRNDMVLERGTFRARGDVVDVFPADSDCEALRIEWLDDEISRLYFFDPLTGAIINEVDSLTLYPKTHYVTPRDRVLKTMELVKAELNARLEFFYQNNLLLEAQRLRERAQYDLEMMMEMGYCSGIENYSRYLSNRAEGEPPPTLFSYLPSDAILFVDESHVTMPQIGGMYRGDRARKETLVKYGFRLPSALDNRPLRFEEFEALAPQTIFVSATPSHYEAEHAKQVVELLTRPTGIVDPRVEVRPVASQVDDVMHEIHLRAQGHERVLITTLTKRMAEDLTNYLSEHGIRVRYLHSDIDAVERSRIVQALRAGEFDVLVGINLLREGLDLPEVSLVAIFDADKEGFLRSTRSLIQTIGRAARNLQGMAILYADRITDSMAQALSETDRRRKKQTAYNEAQGIIPQALSKPVTTLLNLMDPKTDPAEGTMGKSFDDPKVILAKMAALEKEMRAHVKRLAFEEAAVVRDHIAKLRARLSSSC